MSAGFAKRRVERLEVEKIDLRLGRANFTVWNMLTFWGSTRKEGFPCSAPVVFSMIVLSCWIMGQRMNVSSCAEPLQKTPVPG